MTLLILVVLALGLIAYYLGRSRAMATVGGDARQLHSRPHYYGYFTSLSAVIPALLLVVIWMAVLPGLVDSMVLTSLPEHLRNQDESRLGLLLNDVRNLATGNITSGTPDADIRDAAGLHTRLTETGTLLMWVAAMVTAVIGYVLSTLRITPRFRARNTVERVIHVILVICSTIAILTTVGIVFSLIFETLRFLDKVPFWEFLFGTKWAPQTAIRADQVAGLGAFGAVPLLVGTLLITVIAMLVAVPIGLMSAIYLSDYAGPRTRSIVKPILEILAGIPTVVYGFFAALTVAPALRGVGAAIGLDVASESALAAGLVMGIMIIPFVSSLSDDVINAVPQSLREGAFGLGATRSECIKTVVLPAALPGVFAAILLAISRAIGETMIVVMAAGLAANLTINPLEAVTTVTVQIVILLVGDQEFDSAKTLAAFALGMVLFVATLIMNIVALRVVRAYREKYD